MGFISSEEAVRNQKSPLQIHIQMFKESQRSPQDACQTGVGTLFGQPPTSVAGTCDDCQAELKPHPGAPCLHIYIYIYVYIGSTLAVEGSICGYLRVQVHDM